MSRWAAVWLALCCWLCGGVVCPGQMTDSLGRLRVDLPVPPPSHVLDVAGLFDRHPEKFQQISGMLKDLEKKHDMPVYVAVYAGLLRGGVTDQAKVLFDSWVGPGADGMVVVCDTDTQQLDVGLPVSGFSTMGEGGARASRLPDGDVIPILLELKQVLEGREDRMDYLVEMTTHLTTRLDEVLSAKEAVGTDRGVWMIAVGTLLVVGALAGLGWWGSRSLTGSEEKAREQFFFPDVLVGVRLGAQCGGGRVAVKNYGEASEQKGE